MKKYGRYPYCRRFMLPCTDEHEKGTPSVILNWRPFTHKSVSYLFNAASVIILP